MNIVGRLSWVALGTVVLTGAAACVLGSRSSPKLARVEAGVISERIIGRGVVAPRQGVVAVRALVDGRVVAVHVRDGEPVKAGQLLAELEPQGLDSEVRRRVAEKAALEAAARTVTEGARPEERRQLEAELAGARAELMLSEAELVRSERVASSGGIAPAALEQNRTAVSVARARVEALAARLSLADQGGTTAERRAAAQRVLAADASVHQAQQLLGWARVTAPIDGVVLSHAVSSGDVAYAGPLGNALFEVANVDNPELSVEIEEADALRVRVGLEVELRVGTSVCKGAITRVSPKLVSRAIGVPGSRDRADALVRVAWADVSWSALASAPAVGQRFDVDIRMPSVSATALVPRSAIKIDDGRAFVELKSGLGFKKVEVSLGVADGQRVAVGGLPTDADVRAESEP